VRLASINARPYGADGAPRSAQFVVGTSIPTNLRIPAVGMTATGDFVVAWQSDTSQVLPVATPTIADGAGIYIRRYSLNGTAKSAAVNADEAGGAISLPGGLNLPTVAPTLVPSGASDRPAIAVGAGGNFVVAWQRNLEDFTPTGAFARRYDASGKVLGTEITVGTSAQPLRFPQVAINRQGIAAVIAHADGVYAQVYGADGNPIGGSLRLDDGTPNISLLPAIATDASGNFIAVWQDFGRDGDGRGIVARRFTP
jgi:hypothetical protein